jgi:hypothetical protein
MLHRSSICVLELKGGFESGDRDGDGNTLAQSFSHCLALGGKGGCAMPALDQETYLMVDGTKK